MNTYHIDIDGYIGEWSYSKRYVTGKLNEMKGKPVMFRMSSLGGSLIHGLEMADRVGEHGDVTVDLFGFNASSATLATLKAKKVRGAQNGFYLIHQVMSPIVVWDNLNADQLNQLIQELISEKETNEKLDQVIAQMYANKTGKSIKEMLDLMKVGGWMTNEEALQWGFIDELLPADNKINMARMREKLNAMELPTVRINTQSLFQNENREPMKKQPIKINAILNVEKLEHDKEGVYLNEEQIEAIETRLNTLETELATEQTERINAENRATTAEDTVATQATRITDLESQVTNLENGAGDTTTTVVTDNNDPGAPAKGKESFANTVKNARDMFELLPD
jgi:ATP-dependent protease ClpP protease subunit